MGYGESHESNGTGYRDYDTGEKGRDYDYHKLELIRIDSYGRGHIIAEKKDVKLFGQEQDDSKADDKSDRSVLQLFPGRSA